VFGLVATGLFSALTYASHAHLAHNTDDEGWQSSRKLGKSKKRKLVLNDSDDDDSDGGSSSSSSSSSSSGKARKSRPILIGDDDDDDDRKKAEESGDEDEKEAAAPQVKPFVSQLVRSKGESKRDFERRLATERKRAGVALTPTQAALQKKMSKMNAKKNPGHNKVVSSPHVPCISCHRVRLLPFAAVCRNCVPLMFVCVCGLLWFAVIAYTSLPNTSQEKLKAARIMKDPELAKKATAKQKRLAKVVKDGNDVSVAAPFPCHYVPSCAICCSFAAVCRNCAAYVLFVYCALLEFAGLAGVCWVYSHFPFSLITSITYATVAARRRRSLFLLLPSLHINNPVSRRRIPVSLRAIVCDLCAFAAVLPQLRAALCLFVFVWVLGCWAAGLAGLLTYLFLLVEEDGGRE
jgi:hypothetical protein